MEAESWIANAYAKINLGLYVLERLPTGYHRIETGFAFIEWHDRFTVTRDTEMHLKISEEEVPTDEENLINQALNALDTYVGLSHSYHIEVEKNIPMGAGLGGGSSDAALILRMINKIEELGLDNQDLMDISHDLGADVPFFIQGNTAIGTGIGSNLVPVDIQPDAWIVTVYPGFNSNTAEAYQNVMSQHDPEFSVRYILEQIPMEEWRYMLVNDLEPGLMQQHRQVGNIKDQLYELGASYASLSGSGSSVYGIFEQDFLATDAFNLFAELDYRVNITKPNFEPDYGIYRRA